MWPRFSRETPNCYLMNLTHSVKAMMLSPFWVSHTQGFDEINESKEAVPRIGGELRNFSVSDYTVT